MVIIDFELTIWIGWRDSWNLSRSSLEIEAFRCSKYFCDSLISEPRLNASWYISPTVMASGLWKCCTGLRFWGDWRKLLLKFFGEILTKISLFRPMDCRDSFLSSEMGE